MALRSQMARTEGAENALVGPTKLKTNISRIPTRPALGEIGNQVGTNIFMKDAVTKPVYIKPQLLHSNVVSVKSVHQFIPLKDQEKCQVEDKQIIDNSEIISKLSLGPSRYKELPSNVEDADKNDESNLFLVSEYVNDVYHYLRSLEDKFPVRENYLNGREITGKMRAVLVDWLVEVQGQFRFLQETLHRSVSIVDLYLQEVNTISKENLQLVGVCAAFIASKYEEIYPPELSEFVFITDSAYNKEDILKMEKQILKKIQFNLGRPISITFLRRYSKVAKAQAIHHAYGKYFIDLALVEYSLCHVKPSMLAAVATFLSHCVVGNNKGHFVESKIWTPTLRHYSTYEYKDFVHLIPEVVKLVLKAPSARLQAVRTRYSTQKQSRVSLQSDISSDSKVLNQLLALVPSAEN